LLRDAIEMGAIADRQSTTAVPASVEEFVQSLNGSRTEP
jgi:hypothetical protein